MNTTLKPYTAKNYRKTHYFLGLSKLTLFCLRILILGTSVIYLQSQFLEISHSEVLKVEPSSMESPNYSQKSFANYEKKFVNPESENIPTENLLSKNKNNSVAKKITMNQYMAVVNDQRAATAQTIDPSLSWADIDGDQDVDAYDYERFRRDPFDLNNDGKVNIQDKRDFQSRVGWRNYKLVGWKRYK